MQPSQSNDRLLLYQMEQGSEQAFNVLFDKYWQQAYSDAYKRVRDSEVSKDIVQEIFTSIWINREKLHIENFQAYLHIAIRNKVIKYFTKQTLTHSFFNITETISAKSFNADSELLWKEFMKSYEAVIETLPPKRQMIFRLRYQEDLPTKKISLLLGISKKTVQNQLGKAIETLKVSILRMFLIVLITFIASL